jgi:hypothetical protein
MTDLRKIDERMLTHIAKRVVDSVNQSRCVQRERYTQFLTLAHDGALRSASRNLPRNQ